MMNVKGTEKYNNSFEWMLMSSIFYEVLTQIDYVNTVMQARAATFDKWISQLVDNLTELRNNWEVIFAKAILASENKKSFGYCGNHKKHLKRKLLA
ncbi:hypothetical protein PR048_028458 [Dryococelus australis]|uniref:Uncharacterized protein n=1 Tax=Dryococelus australis TaxID=614101 RepID=A0ABQ9GAL5_9NEOP|nr:hypothetical protein PR048_028458 [Dryococelus australis]